MRYHGGKCRLGPDIAELLKKITNGYKIKGYWEPFCGALGVMNYMTDDYYKCYASDACQDLIMLWTSVQKGTFKNPNITEERWRKLKNSKPSPERAFAAFGCSYGGRWFSTYADNYITDSRRSFAITSFEKIEKMKPKLTKVNFLFRNYKNHIKPIENGGFLIYCDPPYENSVNNFFGISYPFDSKEFWDTARLWSSWGNIVIVSNKTAPSDFKCIYSKKIKCSANNNVNNSYYSDKLFIHKY